MGTERNGHIGARNHETMTAPQRAQRWAHLPELPLQTAPFLHRPLNWGATVKHVARSWGPSTPRLLMLAVAVGVWLWASPDSTTTTTLGWDWIALIWLRNLAIVVVVAGGAHLWLHRWAKQGNDLRYDARPLARNKRIFLLRDQVLDNMILTLGPGVAIWTAAEAIMLWTRSNGIGLIAGPAHPAWAVLLVVLIPYWSLTYFSIGHRLLHTDSAYRRVHSWHHKNTNVGPWSGLAMHPIEHLVLFGDIVLLLIVPWHPIHLYFLLLHHGIGAPLSHTGFDRINLPLGTRLNVGDFHHQLHHRFRECNYGGTESPLDERLGTFHDGTEHGGHAMAQRRNVANKTHTT